MYKRGGLAFLIAEKTCCVVLGRLKISKSIGVLKEPDSIKMFFEVPLFGFGQASNAGVTYQSLFGYRFFPSDLGLIGVFF